MNIQKELQLLIGSLIGKDYFKLEFGCEVNRHCNHREVIVGMFNDIIALVRMNENGAYLPFEVPKDTMFTNIPPVTPWEIIGQEPSLNDVLMAISCKFGYNFKVTIFQDNKIEIEESGVFVRYDLSKSLFNQSEETLQAIYNLLKSDEK